MKKTTTNPVWRCFHCNEVFTKEDGARKHFGETQCAKPLCQISREEISTMQHTIDSFANEDTELHRQIQRMQGEHSQELMRAEEKGYAKGLDDGKKMATCDHDWKWHHDWDGDAGVIGGTRDVSWRECTKCGLDDYETAYDGSDNVEDHES